jgi:hypothetical protein
MQHSKHQKLRSIRRDTKFGTMELLKNKRRIKIPSDNSKSVHHPIRTGLQLGMK